ncbi:YMGG-like glycine zipper-containing protein [Allosphingosinicella sp.]|uniref:YMGG-like glycine zipper-containing protein n=1 Tax=Allosphingosinicella sp. TaxID=2823234 RepID=UPI002FC1C1AA
MRKTGMIGIVLAASMSLGACTTYDRGYGYGYDDNRDIRGAATGAAVGAAVGAGVGAVVEGLDPLEGAAGGAVIGGIVGAIASDSDPGWYRDERGYCFYVDRDARRVYDYDRRC